MLPDGRTASAVISWTLVNQNTIRWRATDRKAGGESLPDVDIRLARAGARPPAGAASR